MFCTRLSLKVWPTGLELSFDDGIGEEQSAFVPCRLIMDNVVVAYESVHAIKRRKKGKIIVV